MISVYRLAHLLYRWKIPVLPKVLYVINRLVFSVVLPPSVRIGKGVVLGYQGLGTVIHAHAVIGDDVNIGPGVTIGGRSGLQEVPVIEDGVILGSGAKILGPVRVGKYARIGANAVVLKDVPPFATAVGVPARIIQPQQESSVYLYKS